MPYATSAAAVDSRYFLLDGTRNITGPTTIVNNVPLLASDVLTIRGAAGQTGKLLTLENSALTDVFTVDNSGTLTINPAVNTSGLVVSGASLTGANAQSLISLAQTWNTSGTPTAILLNVTNTASNAASKLIDLQVGGVSRFNVLANGAVTGGAAAFTTVAASAATSYPITVTASLSSPLGFKATNNSSAGLATFDVQNDTGQDAYFRVYGSAFALVDLRNQAGFGAKNSIVIFSDGNVANGGTNSIQFRTGGYEAAQERMRIDSAGVTTLKATNAVTNTVTNALTLGHNSSGTPVPDFGTGLLFQGESSATENRDMGRVRTLWQTATDASRAADLVLTAFGVANEREGIRIRGGASGAELAFFGGTPAAKPSLGAWAGLTTDQKLDALRDALNTLSLASYS